MDAAIDVKLAMTHRVSSGQWQRMGRCIAFIITQQCGTFTTLRHHKLQKASAKGFSRRIISCYIELNRVNNWASQTVRAGATKAKRNATWSSHAAAAAAALIERNL